MNSKLAESLEWYVKRISEKYKVSEDVVQTALAESLQQDSIFERIYNDACYVIERDLGIN